MSRMQENPYATGNWAGGFAASADEWERTTFIRRTYTHLALAVAVFIAIEMVIFNAVPENELLRLTRWMTSGFNWAIVLGAFMVVSMIANRWAMSATSLGKQYAGLSAYVAAEAVIFIPILLIAQRVGGNQDTNLIGMAGMMTAVVFGGLTVLVFLTGADFSWLGRFLALASLVALGFIFGGIFFGFNFGQLFMGLMVALAAGYILYYTSNVMHHYRTDQYVAAALALFASVALLFWYILQLVMATRD